MSRNKIFKSLEEATAYLFSEDIEAGIIIMPPDVDDLTDEEEFDDDNLGTPVVSDVAGTLEITIPDDNDNSIISDKKRKTIPVNVKEKCQLYGRMKPRLIHLRLLQNSSKRNSDILTADSNNMSPVELFEEFLTESVYDMIVEETNRYAHEVKNKLNVTKDEIIYRIFDTFGLSYFA